MKRFCSKTLLISVLTGIVICLAIIVISRWKQRHAVSEQISLEIIREAYAAVNNS